MPLTLFAERFAVQDAEEPAPAHGQPGRNASTDTITKADSDRDHWSAASTDTVTRAQTDRDHWGS